MGIFPVGSYFTPPQFLAPVLIAPLCWPVLLEVIYNRLYKHLVNNNILVKEQFGFRTNLSTNNATYRLFDQILTALNEGNNVGGIFCDLEKAFDCVNLKILLSKLEFYGISGSMLKLITSYLTRKILKNKIGLIFKIISHLGKYDSVLRDIVKKWLSIINYYNKETGLLHKILILV
jgi:hypothetical protein